MADNNDILGASFTIDASEARRGAQEFITTLDQTKSAVEKNSSAIDAMSERISKGTLKSKDAFEKLNKEIDVESKNIERMANENARALERIASKQEELQKKRTGNYNSNELNNISKQLNKLQAEQQVRQGLNRTLDESRAKLAAVSDEVRKFDASKMTNQTQSLRTEMRGIASALAQMEAAGLRGTKAYADLQARGAKLTDMMGDARKQMQLLSHDNATLQGVISGVQGVTGAFTAASGAVALFGGKNEELQQAMLKVQAVMSISMGVQQVLNTLNKDSALRLGIVSKLELFWANCKAQAAAATAAQTVAQAASNAEKVKEVGIDAAATTAQSALTGATERATVANTAHAFSWKAVGIAIKSVPVFGWIITGLAAVAAAIAYFVKKSSEAVTQQKLLKQAMKDSAESIAEERTKLDLLYKRATDTNKSMDERLKAVKALKTQYPDYFKSLKDETILVGNAANAYRKLARDIKESAITRGLETQLQDDAKTLAKWYADNADEAQWLADNRNRVKQLKAQGVKGKNTMATAAGAPSYAVSFMQKDAESLAPTADEILVATYDSRYAAYKAKYKKDNKKALKNSELISSMLSKRNAAVDVHEDTSEKETKDTTTSTTKSTTSTTKSTTPIDEAAEARKRERAIEDAQNAEAELEIKYRKKGLAKVLAEIELEKTKKMQALNRALEDEQLRLQQLDKQAGKDAKELKAYSEAAKVNTGYDVGVREIQAQAQEKTRAAYKEQVDALNDFIKEYGTVQERRLATEREYTQKMKAAREEGDTATEYSLKMQLESLRKKWKDEDLSNSADWLNVFGDLTTMTRSQLLSAKNYLKNELNDKSLNVDQYKTIVEQIDKINTQLLDNEHTLSKAFGLQTEHLQKQRKLKLEIKEATEQEAKQQSEMMLATANTTLARQKVQGLIKSSGASVNANINDTNALATAIKQSESIDEAVKAKILDAIYELTLANIKEEDEKNKLTSTQNRLSNLYASLSQENSWRNQLSSVGSIFSTTSSNISSITSALGSGSSKSTAVLSDVMSALNSSGAAMQSLANDDYAGAISNSAAALASVVSAVSQATDKSKKLQTKLTGLANAIDVLSDNIQNFITKMSKASTTLVDAISYSDLALSSLNSSLETAYQQAYYALQETDGGKWGNSYANKIKKGDGYKYAWIDYYDQINAALGGNYTNNNARMDWLTNLTGSQLQIIKEKFYFLWAELTDTQQNAFEQIIAYEEQVESILDALREKLTGFSFDTLESEFINTLMSMDSDVDDFVESISEKFMSAQLSNYITSAFGDELNQWYEDFAASMEAGGLTSADVTRLRTTYQELAARALDARDSIAEITGYDLTSSQSSTSRAVSSMSQSTADELNGRFTAIQIATEAIRAQIESQSVSSQSLIDSTKTINANTASIAESVRQTIEIQQTSAEHLAKIEGYTSNLPSMLAALVNIEKNTKNL